MNHNNNEDYEEFMKMDAAELFFDLDLSTFKQTFHELPEPITSIEKIMKTSITKHEEIGDFISKFSFILDKISSMKHSENVLDELLECAVVFSHQELTSLLLEKGADFYYRNEENETLLGLVLTHINYDFYDIDNETEKRKNMFRFLLRKGARLLHLDFKNRHALQIIYSEELDHLLPILEECVPFFDEQQKNDWKIIQMSQLFK